MKTLLLLITLLFVTNISATINEDDNLQIVRDGLVILVVDFQEGDKIKLFEVETDEHILSKTRGELDLSQLPEGTYRLENNIGQSVIIEKTEFDIVFDEELGGEYIVNEDGEIEAVENEVDFEKELENYYVQSELNPLMISREGNVVTVDEFEEGDKIKLFEIKNTVHILSKTVGVVDMSQLPAGKYLLENNKGQSVVIEKIDSMVIDGVVDTTIEDHYAGF